MLREEGAIMADRQRLIELALKGLQADRAKIDDEIGEIKSQLNSGGTIVKAGQAASGVITAQPNKKRTMSAGARKKISEAMKRRYADIKNAESKPKQAKQTSGGGLTAAARKKLSEMTKARWAARKRGSSSV
jgi:hypothetical protein